MKTIIIINVIISEIMNAQKFEITKFLHNWYLISCSIISKIKTIIKLNILNLENNSKSSLKSIV